MRKKIKHSVPGYATDPLSALIVAEGVQVQCGACSWEWRKKQCVPARRCSRYWPQGWVPRLNAVARLLHLSAGKISARKLDAVTIEKEREAFKQCRRVMVTVRELR